MTVSELESAAGRAGVLVLEDSMIIAMDTEEMLYQLGFEQVKVAGSAAMAFEHLGNFSPLFALLDFNLGEGTSEGVADYLTARAIPFWFVTGYGDAVGQLSENEAHGVLQKPFVQADLARVVGELAGATGLN